MKNLNDCTGHGGNCPEEEMRSMYLEKIELAKEQKYSQEMDSHYWLG